jgi:hypothetical protein
MGQDPKCGCRLLGYEYSKPVASSKGPNFLIEPMRSNCDRQHFQVTLVYLDSIKYGYFCPRSILFEVLALEYGYQVFLSSTFA